MTVHLPKRLTKRDQIKKNGIIYDIRRRQILYLMALPGILYYVIFHYLPMGGIVLAFQDYDIFSGILHSPWAGLKHFRRLFENELFYRALGNSLILSLLKLLICFPAPILFAILLNEIKSKKFMRTVQTITYFPHFLSWVVVAGLLNTLLSPSDGAVNMLILSLIHI